MDMNWILDEYDGIIYVSDMESYEVKYLNKMGRRLCNVTREEIAGGRVKCHKLLQGLDEPCPFCTNCHLNDTGFYEWEHENVYLNRTFLLKDRKLEWDGRAARIEFATDVSVYRDKIASKERERDSVLKSLPGGIARVDARDLRTILWYGANFLPMIGYTREEFEKELHNKCDYVHPDDLPKITDIMLHLKETGRIVITEMKIITRKGDIRTLTTTFSYEDGEVSEDGIPSIYSVGIDITEIKEEQERQKEALSNAYQAAWIANQAKTTFLSNMSHDIRTPLNAILGMTAIAGLHLTDSSRVEDCLDKINKSSRHLLSLINEVLDMSKIESGKMELSLGEFELSESIRNVIDLCRPMIMEKQHEVKVDNGNIKHEKVIGDMEKLQQVFVNILSNAVKYTPQGGSILLRMEERQTHVPDIGVYSFIFEDNGIGMSAEYRKHVFESFSRAEDPRLSKIQGTGLGMTISENIIHMMGGSIDVVSELGKGSRFTVSVPLKTLNTTEAEAHPKTEMTLGAGAGGSEMYADPARKSLSGRRLLLAEDNELNREIETDFLREYGAIVEVAENGRMAVEIFNRSEPGWYDAILMDVRMPEMNGYEAAKAIRAMDREDALSVPIIALTANAFSEDVQASRNAGMNRHVAKPIEAERLCRIICQCIRGSE